MNLLRILVQLSHLFCLKMWVALSTRVVLQELTANTPCYLALETWAAPAGQAPPIASLPGPKAWPASVSPTSCLFPGVPMLIQSFGKALVGFMLLQTLAGWELGLEQSGGWCWLMHVSYPLPRATLAPSWGCEAAASRFQAVCLVMPKLALLPLCLKGLSWGWNLVQENTSAVKKKKGKFLPLSPWIGEG